LVAINAALKLGVELPFGNVPLQFRWWLGTPGAVSAASP
jgi:hypothetical protein